MDGNISVGAGDFYISVETAVAHLKLTIIKRNLAVCKICSFYAHISAFGFQLHVIRTLKLFYIQISVAKLCLKFFKHAFVQHQISIGKLRCHFFT